MASTITGGSIVWNLDADTAKFDRGIDSSKSKIKELSDTTDKAAGQMSDSINGSTNSIVSAFHNAEGASKAFATGLGLIGGALIGAAGFGIKVAADIETMRAGFVTLLGSTEKADAAIEKIKKDAASTPFELPGLIQANQLLTSVTKDADRSERLLLNVGKALTAMGKGQPELDRIIINLQQIAAVGKASTLDIKQFAFAGIPIFDLLKKELEGTTTATVDNTKAIGKKNEQLSTLQGQLKAAEQRQKEFNSKTKESTKITNQNQIDKYRGQIAALSGDVGKLNSENGKLTKGQVNLQQAIEDGVVTFELLEGLFNKAGEGKGQFARAFIEQAGTFNQLMSNFKDNIGIAAAEIVKSTGIFDGVKSVLADLIENIGKFTPNIIQGFKDFFTFVKENGPIILGIIAGGLTPAFAAIAVSVGAATLALAPFLLAGAAVGVLVKQMIDSGITWQMIVDGLKSSWQQFSDAFRTHVQPALTELINTVQTELIPSLQRLWEQVGPLLGPALKLLGTIIGTLAIGSLKILVSALTSVTNAIITVSNALTWLIEQLRNLAPSVQSAMSGVKNALVGPFTDALSSITTITGKIREMMDRINPFHRESPSLVDNVISGIKVIKSQFGSLDSLNLPTVQALGPQYAMAGSTPATTGMSGGGGYTQNISIDVGSISSRDDIESMLRELGYRAAISPEISS